MLGFYRLKNHPIWVKEGEIMLSLRRCPQMGKIDINSLVKLLINLWFEYGVGKGEIGMN